MKTEASRKTVGGLLGLHAQSPLHPGAGTALGAVDLPVQRERHTHWPNAAGSSIKGILRDACREQVAQMRDLESQPRHDDKDEKQAERSKNKRENADNTLLINELFGPPASVASEFAGSLSVTDARLLAFPVRSLKGVFAWVTCPAVLDRLTRDAELAHTGRLPDCSKIATDLDDKKKKRDFPCVVSSDCPCLIDGCVVLEEYEFKKIEGASTRPSVATVGHAQSTRRVSRNASVAKKALLASRARISRSESSRGVGPLLGSRLAW